MWRNKKRIIIQWIKNMASKAIIDIVPKKIKEE
jgi:hypothetical protein